MIYQTNMTKRIFSIIGKALLGLLGVWLAILVILEIVLSPAVTSKVIRKVATEYVDGSLNFSKARISLFKKFPSLYVDIEDFSLTYPADRFDELENGGAQGWLLHHGCGENSDTLASFSSFKTSIRILPLLRGDIKIPYLNLDKPRIFAHSYDSENANWNIFKLADNQETEIKDTTESEETFPALKLGKISLSGHPHIVYTDSRDTLFALLRFKELKLNDMLNLELDSLIAAGRLGRDTIAFGMQSLRLGERGKKIDLHADARTLLATKALGRLDIPIHIDGSAAFPKDSVLAISVERLNADIATIPISFAGDIRMHEDGLFVDAQASVNKCNLNGLLKGLAKNIVPEADKISTNALLSLHAQCNGKYIYETGRLPEMTVSVDLPKSRISHTALAEDISLAIEMNANVDDSGRINANISRTDISTRGLRFNLSGKGADILGANPKLNIKGSLEAVLEDLATFIPDSLAINTSGNITAALEGEAFLSQLNMYKFSEANLKGGVQGKDINIQIPDSELKAYVQTLDIQLGPEDQKSRRDSTTSMRMLALRGNIDSLNLAYGNLTARGRNLGITAKSSAEALKGGQNFHQVGGLFKAEHLSADDGAGTRLFLKETSNGFFVMPDKDNPKIPILTFTSRNKAIAAKSGLQRAGLKDATIIASATLNKIKRDPRARAQRKRQGEAPEWMQETDFRKQDINIRLDDELAKYFKEWQFRGSVKIGGGFIATPFFPLKNRLNGFHGRFTSNEINILDFSIASGKSDIQATGKLRGFGRMLAGGRGGMLNLDLNINSNNIDADQLLRAYNAGLKFDEKKNGSSLDTISDEEYAEVIAADSTQNATTQIGTVVVPGNINARIALNTKNIKYAGLLIDSLKSTAVIKERCIQVTGTEAKSNVGDISFNGFYASRNKKDIKAGFSVDFKDITAEKVISLMPAIDTLMPILKSFHGLLNCEIAATSQLDTNMNLMMPTINGILRITGDSLAVKNNQMFQKLARKLLFRNTKEGQIDHMSVEGVISDNVVEVFPFVLTMDRYTLALSGVQNLDMSFKYHVSLIKSPFLIKLGLDISGEDFDNMKFHIGRPKYKNPDIPVFSKVIDDTKINLVTSIEDIFKKGVDAAIREHNAAGLIRQRKKEINYVRAVDQQLEALSDADQKKFEEEEAKQSAEEQIKYEQESNN